MNTRNQFEIDAVADAEAAAAGFTTAAVDRTEEGNARAARRHQEQLDADAAADSALQFIPPTFSDNPTPASFLNDGHTEPSLEQPAPEVETLATDTAIIALSVYLADCWGQKTVDEAAYNAVKHLEIESLPTDTTGLILRDPLSNDTVGVGFIPDTNKQAVLGDINITAAQALNRARLAMTSDLMRTQGIDEVHGTEMDKALLLLAAETVGLTINNIPTIAPEVMNEARQQWSLMIALSAVRAGATEEAALDIAETLTPDAPGSGPRIDLSDIAFDEGDQPVVAAQPSATDDFAETQPMAYEEEIAVPGVHAAAVAATESAAAPTVDTQETVQDIIAEQTTPDPGAIAAAPVVEVTSVPVEAVAEAAAEENNPAQTLRPEVLTALGDDGLVSKDDYVAIRNRIKAGDEELVSKEGFISSSVIRKAFIDAGKTDGSTKAAKRVLSALEADLLAYTTTQTVPAYRTVVNYQVKSPVYHPPRVMPQ